MSKTTTSPLLWLPSAADGVQVTPSGTAWANSAWVEVSASAPSTVYPAFIVALPNNAGVVATLSAEFDIGIGAASSEVVVATTAVRIHPDLWGTSATVPLGVLYSSIASGSRIAVRVRHSATANTNIYRMAIGYYAALGGATGWTPTAPTVAPLAGAGVTVTCSATPWAFGSWVQVLASAASNIVVTGIVIAAPARCYEVQIGTGGSGSETAVLTLPYAMTAGGGDGFNYVRFARPLCLSTGTRISLRTRSAASSTSQVFGTIWYTANP